MNLEQLQQQCEIGQQQLMRMQYLQAAETLAAAEQTAWELRDYDTLARLYLPLQEARRQVRQSCGEGVVKLDCFATDPTDSLDATRLLNQFPHGQLLIAGWGTIEPALEFRRLALHQKRYAETFLGAVFPIVGGARAVVIVPMAEARLPDPQPRSIDALVHQLPVNCLVFGPNELPQGEQRGTTQTYGQVMALWERLHQPFLTAADLEVDPIRRMQGYRQTIRVDSACELAHQKLSDVAKELARAK